ncbi:uncharacterized protein LOC135696917 [Ochlerotatus camptorhynchus]|uniref:uncharacterized protein LOC135696917 n=1 Tax=Ochlerotatus camptorhynchus TaxID=644619 RepID=UPI0031D825B5
MKADERLVEMGNNVRSIRRTRTGEMLLVLKRGAKDQGPTYQKLANGVVGNGVQVRSLGSTITIQIKDLDEVIEATKLDKALREQCQIEVPSTAVTLRKGLWPTLPGGQEQCSAMFEVAQLNLNHCSAAQQLLWQSAVEWGVDVAIISGPYRVPSGNGNWVEDALGMAAICTMGSFPVQEVVSSNSSEGFVITRMMDILTAVLVGLRPVFIAGDFNDWAVEWGSHHTNQRGCILLEAMAKLDVVLANTGSVFGEALRRERITPDLTGEELVASLARACDTTMPRRAYPRHGHRPVYWWSESIAILRASCLHARRRMQRARTTESREERRVALRAAKAALNKEIGRHKCACFDSLCQRANTNPWGDAYKVVMAKTRGVAAPPDRSPAMLASIVGFLFPRRDVDSWPWIREKCRVTNRELSDIVKSLVTCLDVGIFPDAWKQQRLVLLPKPGKPPGDPSTYRPICLLDTTGKLLESVILNRLSAYTEGVDCLSSSQYGFRKGRSTVEAICDVIQTAEVVHRKRRGIG